MKYELRLYHDRFESKSAPVALHRALGRALYVVDGALAMRSSGNASTSTTLGPNSAVFVAVEQAVGGGSQPAQVLRWELMPQDTSSELRGDVRSQCVLAAPMALDDPVGYLLRCDRVDFPPGGEALTHTHQGGGIRCLLFGSIRIETKGTNHAYGPLGAWFEAGPDTVHAAADTTQASAFARVMVLPRALLGGKSSIKYVYPGDLDKPKSQRYQIFIDHPIELPR